MPSLNAAGNQDQWLPQEVMLEDIGLFTERYPTSILSLVSIRKEVAEERPRAVPKPKKGIASGLVVTYTTGRFQHSSQLLWASALKVFMTIEI